MAGSDVVKCITNGLGVSMRVNVTGASVTGAGVPFENGV